MATKPQTSTKPMMENNNVVGGPLALFSKDPPAGYFRDGFCRTTAEDTGNHSIAAIVTSEFLDFTQSRGNNLSTVPVKPGQKWCLCAHRWQEAMQAAQQGQLAREAVPKVNLAATHESALKLVSYKDLKSFAAERELQASGRQEGHYDPESGGNTLAKHSDQIGDHDLSSAPGAGSHAKSTDLKTTAPRG